MFLYFKRAASYQCSSKLTSISWRQSSEGGWLVTGNRLGGLGVTSFGQREELDSKLGTANLSDHISEVKLVQWRHAGSGAMAPMMVSVDNSGVICFWKEHKDFLVKDRTVSNEEPIIDLQWNNGGDLLAILLEDSTILLCDSNATTCFWSHRFHRMINNNDSSTAAMVSMAWSPDNTRIMLGTSDGRLIEIDASNSGRVISTTECRKDVAVNHLQWVTCNGSPTLTVYLANGELLVVSSTMEGKAIYINTGISDGRLCWNQDRTAFAVAGKGRSSRFITVRVMSSEGNLLATACHKQKAKVTGLEWSRIGEETMILVSAGNSIYSVHCSVSVPSLQMLCESRIADTVPDVHSVEKIALPFCARNSVLELMKPDFAVALHFDLTTLDGSNPEQFICSILSAPQQLIHCAIIPLCDEGKIKQSKPKNSLSYLMCLEYLGNLVPLMMAKRKSSKFGKGGFIIHSCNVPALTGSVDMEETDHPVYRHTIPTIADPLATVTYNSLQHKYKFHGVHKQIGQDYGELSIISSMARSEPRRVSVTLRDKTVLSSRLPEWSEYYGYFMVDSSARVSRDSIKNMQLLCDGEQVLQFGRSSHGNFVLDFKSPCAPLQAFCIALSCVI